MCLTHFLTTEDVITYSIIMLFVLLLRIILRYLTLRLRSTMGYEVMCEERKKLGRELRKIPMGFFSKKNIGWLKAAITPDAAFIEIEGLGVIEKAAAGIPAAPIGLAILFYFKYRIALTVCFLFIPVYIFYGLYFSVHKKINRQELIGEITEDAVEFIKGLHVIKMYNMANF